MDNLRRFFKSRFRAKESTNGWYRFVNPLDKGAHRDNMAVNFEYNWVKDFKTGYSANIYKFIGAVDGRTYGEIAEEFGPLNFTLRNYETDLQPVSKAELPDGYKSLLYPKGVLGNRARRYIKGRGIDVDYVDMLGFGYCNEGDFMGYIIIPFKEQGELVYYTGRDFIGNYLRHKNPKQEHVKVGKGDVVFNADALDMYEEINITEGVFDALTAGPNTIALGGWSLSRRQFSMLFNSGVPRFTVIPDAGYVIKAMQTFSKLAEHREMYFCNIDLVAKYKGEKHLKDINELGRDLVMGTRFGPVDSFSCQFGDFK